LAGFEVITEAKKRAGQRTLLTQLMQLLVPTATPRTAKASIS